MKSLFNFMRIKNKICHKSKNKNRINFSEFKYKKIKIQRKIQIN